MWKQPRYQAAQLLADTGIPPCSKISLSRFPEFFIGIDGGVFENRAAVVDVSFAPVNHHGDNDAHEDYA